MKRRYIDYKAYSKMYLELKEADKLFDRSLEIEHSEKPEDIKESKEISKRFKEIVEATQLYTDIYEVKPVKLPRKVKKKYKKDIIELLGDFTYVYYEPKWYKMCCRVTKEK